jgi:hypothetical protein
MSERNDPPMMACGHAANGTVTATGAALPFFKYQPDRAEDSFYCGDCWGWD